MNSKKIVHQSDSLAGIIGAIKAYYSELFLNLTNYFLIKEETTDNYARLSYVKNEISESSRCFFGYKKELKKINDRFYKGGYQYI